MERITITIDDELLKNIKKQIKNSHTSNVSNFFNEAARFKLNQYKNQYQTEFMWYIALPFLGFIGCLYATIYLASMFFFIITGVVGLYLIIFITLFLKKYRGKKI